MAPSVRTRPSPFDRNTDASASAIASGFSAVMALGPQPKSGAAAAAAAGMGREMSEEGTDWLRNLRQASGMFDADANEDENGMMSDDDDEGDSDGEGATASKKRGKAGASTMGGKKAGGKMSAAAIRKAQNRLAQREFRQRKQQYIRALEARVELLSSDHDTQVDRLRYALRGLLAENNQLRTIVSSFAMFVGVQQIGGPLQKAGLSRSELEELIGNSAEKVMAETWQNWPNAKECEALRQIRLDSNLPPEGLPESARLSEHAKANTLRANAAKEATARAAAAVQEAAPEDKSTTRKKRKASRDSQQLGGTGSTPIDTVASPAGVLSIPSATVPTTASAASSSYSGPTTDTSIMASFFAPGGGGADGQMFNASAPPSNADATAFSFSPSSFGDMQPTSQPQDSNALLASLFGAPGMGGFLGQPDGNGNGNGMLGAPPVGHPMPTSLDEPAEIGRINELVGRLTDERQRFGSGKEVAELTRMGLAFHELVRHMATFRRQPSYHLPLMLEPSEIQQTRRHDPLIDALPFPGIRQNLIAQQDSLVIDDVILSILHFSNLHPGSVIEEDNWELLYGFLVAYPQLVDQKALDIANRWRANRKEPTLTFDDITPANHA